MPWLIPDKIVVTGASAGIGRATCKAFAAAGASVACIARREPELTTLGEEITAASGHAIAIAADVADPDAARRIISQTEERLGPIDILVNNAGISRISPLSEEKDLTTWWKVYEVNVLAPVRLIHAVLPSMIQRKSGIVVSVSSAVAGMRLPVMSAYSSSKAAISKFHEAIVPELAGTGVRSYAVNPGMVGGTELGKSAFNQEARRHPAVRAFLGHLEESEGEMKVGVAELPADFMVALCCDERCVVLDGLHVNADQDLEAVLEDVERKGDGRVEKEGLYRVAIGEL